MKDKTIYLGIIIVNAAILVTAGAYLPVEDEFKGESIDFEVINLGLISNKRTNRTEAFIINSHEEYERIVGRIDNETEINLEENSVLAVLLGQRRTGGYRIEIDEIREKDDRLVIHATETRPGDGCGVIQVLTYPYEAVLIENIEEETEVEINLTVETRDCE